MPDFGTRKPEKPHVPIRLRISQIANKLRAQFTTKESRISLALTIFALSAAIVLLVPAYQGRVLLPGVGDDGFPQGLVGIVPHYEAYAQDDPRDCEPEYPYTSYCYVVITEVNDELSLALIVEDMIRDENIEETGDRMVQVYFRTREQGHYEGEEFARAYAFRDKALEKHYGPEGATVIDGVYVLK